MSIWVGCGGCKRTDFGSSLWEVVGDLKRLILDKFQFRRFLWSCKDQFWIIHFGRVW